MHAPFSLWFTGLSGAGKSTLSEQVAALLACRNLAVERLDADVVRRQYWPELGYSRAQRMANIERLAHLSSMLSRHNVTTLVAAMAPYQEARDFARATVPNFVEVYVQCSLEELIRRDTKGLYGRALRGEIDNFAGITMPFEAPRCAEIAVDTETETVPESVTRIMRGLAHLGYWHGD